MHSGKSESHVIKNFLRCVHFRSAVVFSEDFFWAIPDLDSIGRHFSCTEFFGFFNYGLPAGIALNVNFFVD